MGSGWFVRRVGDVAGPGLWAWSWSRIDVVAAPRWRRRRPDCLSEPSARLSPVGSASSPSCWRCWPSTSVCSTARPTRSASGRRPSGAGSGWPRGGLQPRRLPLVRPRAGPRVHHRLPHREGAGGRQHLRLRRDLHRFRGAGRLPAPCALLGRAGRAGHARRLHPRRRRLPAALPLGDVRLRRASWPSPGSSCSSSATRRSTPSGTPGAGLPALFPVTPSYDGDKFTIVREDGRRYARRSPGAGRGRGHRPHLRGRLHPRHLRRHHRPFIVFTSNIFAILGLRSLYFLLAGVITKFVYLKVGLSRGAGLRGREDAAHGPLQAAVGLARGHRRHPGALRPRLPAESRRSRTGQAHGGGRPSALKAYEILRKNCRLVRSSPPSSSSARSSP